MGRLDGKVALITGAGTGIGAAAARIFAREGAKVAINGRRLAPLEQVAAAVKAAEGEALVVQGDASNEADVARIVGRTVEAFGPITVLFNNAAIGDEESVTHEITPEEWDRTIGINLRGVFLMSRAVIPHMLAAGGGSIINNSSRNALQALVHSAAYSTSKAGLNGLTRVMALEYAQKNIRVNAICPGLVITEMTKEDVKPYLSGEKPITDRAPSGRLGQPEDIAYAALFLASDESTWVTGVSLPVDGGRSIV